MLKLLEEQMQGLAIEADKFSKGNKSAGVRLRKHLAEIKKLCVEYKKQTLQK